MVSSGEGSAMGLPDAKRAPALPAAWCWVAGGAVGLLAALVIHLLDPLDLIIQWQTTLRPGTFAYSFWAEPLDVLYIRTFLFNITNPEAFLSGAEKMRLQELGPFTYREVTHFADLQVHANDTATFRAKRHLEFVPELSAGDPASFNITMPNVPLLGAASALGESAWVTNQALRSLALFLGARPLISLTAEKFMWGYDDPLITMAHTLIPAFVDFERLGLLDRMYTGEDDVAMYAGANKGVDPAARDAKGVFAVKTFNEETGFAFWGHGAQPRYDPHTDEPLPARLSCDTVDGAYEGVLFPRNVVPGQRLYVYRKQFCRSVPIDYQGESVDEDGFRYFLYFLYEDGLLDANNSENLCYCARSAGLAGGCLPRGFSSVAPCYYRMPMALSQPHLMDADPAIFSKVEGMSPTKELHRSYFKLQPETGIPLNIRARLQVNLMMGPTQQSFSKPFDNMAVPMLWVDMQMDLPERLRRLVALAVRVGPAAQAAALALLALAGG